MSSIFYRSMQYAFFTLQSSIDSGNEQQMKSVIGTKWTFAEKRGNERWSLYCFASFLIGYPDNGVSQRRATITKRRPNDATTRRCGYANCWERHLLSRRLLEKLYSRAELSNSSKGWTARAASSFTPCGIVKYISKIYTSRVRKIQRFVCINFYLFIIIV